MPLLQGAFQSYYNFIANMEHVPAKDTPLSSMLAWLNAHVSPRIPTVRTIEQLTDGAAFLTLLAKLAPGIIDSAAICLSPACNLEIDMNLALLASSIRKSGLALPKSILPRPSLIGILAERSPQYSLQLLTFLFHTYSKETAPPKEESDFDDQSKFSQLKILAQPSMKIQLSAKKDVVQSVTDDDLDLLYRLRAKLKGIEQIVKTKLPGKDKILSISSLLKESNPNEQASKKKCPKVITGFTKLLTSELQYLTDQNSAQSFKKYPNDKNEIQIGRQLFTKINFFKNIKFTSSDQNGLLHNIGFFTDEILKSISSQIQFTKEEQTIIDNFSTAHTVFEALPYLFFGRRLTNGNHRRYNFQQDETFKNARKDIRAYCERYYRSTMLVKRILFSTSILLRTKLVMLRMLSNIELLPSRNLKRIEFLSSQYCCYETENEDPTLSSLEESTFDNDDNISQADSFSSFNSSQYYKPIDSNKFQIDKENKPNINVSIIECDDQQSSKIAPPVNMQQAMGESQAQVKDQENEEEANIQKIDDIISTQRRPVNLYWSEHRRVLIAFEAKHIYNKKPNFEDTQSYNKFINSRAHERAEFDGGFLFPGKKSRMDIDFLKVIAESDKYLNLKPIFGAVQSDLRILKLGEFVRIMLDLKHHTILKEFIEIYDVIVGEVKNTSFESVRKPVERFAFVEQVLKKLTRGANRINDYFANNYDMPDDGVEITKLLKVTAYCFLAELHNFGENQFYADAFDFPKIDLKLSSNKGLYEKSTGMKIRCEKK